MIDIYVCCNGGGKVVIDLVMVLLLKLVRGRMRRSVTYVPSCYHQYGDTINSTQVDHHCLRHSYRPRQEKAKGRDTLSLQRGGHKDQMIRRNM